MKKINHKSKIFIRMLRVGGLEYWNMCKFKDVLCY